MESDAKHAYRFCKKILPRVSRTFAINIAVLTGNLHKAVLCAYLFCRIADTVEDSEHLPLDMQEKLLDDYIQIFASKDFAVARIRKWVEPFQTFDASQPYNLLVQNSDQVLMAFLSLPQESQQAIGDCVMEMARGMKETVSRQKESNAQVYSFQTISDLEEYCYYVAGTVGIMLTKLFSQHAPAMSDHAVKLAKKLEVSFGFGLQLTNIIKDCRDDFRRGWCYIPSQLADKHGVPIEKFFDAQYERESLAVLGELVGKAASHLDDALTYTLLIPRREVRMRLFCLWPLFFAIKTLTVVNGNPDLLTGRNRVRISRGEVYETLIHTTLICWSNRLLKRTYWKLRRQLND